MSAHSVYELRNYTMQPGQRDVLIDLFEREFVESQEALGSRVVGTFRDLDNADRFVWLRSFESIETRAVALDGFYTGAVWQRHRTAANATIVDSDDVLQLQPIMGDPLKGNSLRPPIGATETPQSLIVAHTYFVPQQGGVEFAALFEQLAVPALRNGGLAPFATFATEHAPNRYPRLPIRDQETVFVTLTHFASDAAHAEAAIQLENSAKFLAAHTVAPTQVMRLQPTARSLLR